MFSKSSIFILAFIVLIATASKIPPSLDIEDYSAQSENKSNNLIVGSRIKGDRLIHQEYISKTSSFLGIVKVEKSFGFDQYEKITQVVALDQKTNGNGAYPSIVSGGPGFNSVSLSFKSQRGHGIKFSIQIYSKA